MPVSAGNTPTDTPHTPATWYQVMPQGQGPYNPTSMYPPSPYGTYGVYGGMSGQATMSGQVPHPYMSPPYTGYGYMPAVPPMLPYGNMYGQYGYVTFGGYPVPPPPPGYPVMSPQQQFPPGLPQGPQGYQSYQGQPETDVQPPVPQGQDQGRQQVYHPQGKPQGYQDQHQGHPQPQDQGQPQGHPQPQGQVQPQGPFQALPQGLPQGQLHALPRVPAGRGGNERRNDTLPKGLKYDGKDNWWGFKHKFLRYAEVKNWTFNEMRDYLCWSLEGKASDYYASTVQRNEGIGFNDILQRLEKRFGGILSSDNAQDKLSTSHQKADESIEDWADRVMQLA